MKYNLKIQTRYTDFDMQGNVNHIYILGYIELAYLSFLHDVISPDIHFGNTKVQLHTHDGKCLKPILPVSKPVCELSVLYIGVYRVTINAIVYEERNRSHIYYKGRKNLVHVRLPERKIDPFPAYYIENFKRYLIPTFQTTNYDIPHPRSEPHISA